MEQKIIKSQSQLCKQVDLQAMREIFLYEIAAYQNSEVQIPAVRLFLQNHVS